MAPDKVEMSRREEWRRFFSESISLCLPGTGWTHIFIKTSQSAMTSKNLTDRPADSDPLFSLEIVICPFCLSARSVGWSMSVPVCFVCLFVCFWGTCVTVKTQFINLLPPLLSFWEYRFLFHIFTVVLQSTVDQLLVWPRWSEPTRSNLFALVVVSLHCQVLSTINLL